VGFKTGLARAGQDMDLTLTGGTLADLLPGGRPWPRLDVVARTRIDRHQLNIRGHVGPLAAIRTGRDLRLDFNLADDTDLTGTLTGTLASLHGLAGSQFQAQLTGKRLAALHPGLPAQPFSAKARIKAQAGQLDLLAIKAISAGSEVSGEVHIGLGERLRIDASLSADTLDLTPFLARSPDPAPKRAEALPLEGLKALDGSLKLSAGKVLIDDFEIDDGTLDARLDAGHLVLSANAIRGGLSLDLQLRPGQTDWQFDLHHKGKLNLGQLIKATNQQTLSNVPVGVEMRMNAVGASVPQLLRSADGRIELVLGAGQLERKASKLPFGGVVVSLLDTLNPTRLSAVRVRKDLLSLQCAVLQFDIADGIATSKRGLALQTDKLNVLGGGAIRLETEELRLRFKTVKRTGVGLSLLGVEI
jgi:hypothetical protein